MSEIVAIVTLTLLSVPPGTKVKVGKDNLASVVETLSLFMAVLGGVVKCEKAADYEEYGVNLYNLWLEKFPVPLTAEQKARQVFAELAQWQVWDACARIWNDTTDPVMNPFARLKNKIDVVGGVRAATGWGLKDAKNWVEWEENNWTHPDV